MANDNQALSPELASILATLSSFTDRSQQSSNGTHHVNPDLQAPYQVSASNAPDFRSSTTAQDVDGPVSQQRSVAPQRPLIDPASITEWTAGLRCVIKIASQNQHFAESIKRVWSLSDFPISISKAYR